MKKLKVTVLMGGQSPEHEVSLMSGREVVKNIDEKLFDARPVIVSKDGLSWKLVEKAELLNLPDVFNDKEGAKLMKIKGSQELEGAGKLKNVGTDVIFIAMHGPFGEDGTIQGMCELTGIPYTGSKVLASALGMDKIMFRRLMVSSSIPIPRYVVMKKTDHTDLVFDNLGEPPYFVKPYNQGSSVGASIVKTKDELKEALHLAFTYSDTALVDEYIEGRELTCSVLGNVNPVALPVVEIIPKKGEFFNYESKYTESGSEEIAPAQISEDIAKNIQQMSIEVYKLIGCRGFGRVDFILREDGSFVVLEINTIPGLTPASLLPKAAKAGGITYQELITKVVNFALE